MVNHWYCYEVQQQLGWVKVPVAGGTIVGIVTHYVVGKQIVNNRCLINSRR